MTTDRRFAYAQARIQARFAALPTAQDWQGLAASRSLAAFLEDARNGTLRGWIKGFSGQSDVHDLEAGVRVHFREIVDEVAAWVPDRWTPAVRWTRWLTLLPLLDHLRLGGDLPSWVARDPDLSPVLDKHGSFDPVRLERMGAAPLIGSDDPVAAWAAQWRALWPRCGREVRANLEAVAALLADHAAAFRDAPPRSTWALRGALGTRLRHLFHRRLLEPAEAFVFLALAALELERLRAELVGRALFPEEAA